MTFSPLKLSTTYEDRNGNAGGDEDQIVIEERSPDYFDNNGIRKGILLSRYADLVKNWIIDERISYGEKKVINPHVDWNVGIVVPDYTNLGQWERQSMPLQVSTHYKDLFREFRVHFEREMNAIGDNTVTIAIDGKFDDCQRLVKQAFGDPELKNLNLTSANSINIGRILPQVVYYFYSYVNVVDEIRPVIFSVPSGNFGNSLGCEIARRMGLRVEPLIIATNENDEFPKFLESGIYRKVDPSRKCLSNAMNVGNPSNLARYFNLYGGIVDKEGNVHREPDVSEMRKNLYSVSISDEETVRTIKEVYENYNVLLEPHGAVGVAALMNHYKEIDKPALCFETAHPSKFPEIIEEALKITPEPHPSFVDIDDRVIEPEHLPNDYKAFKEYLLS